MCEDCSVGQHLDLHMSLHECFDNPNSLNHEPNQNNSNLKPTIHSDSVLLSTNGNLNVEKDIEKPMIIYT